ncbi:MAG: hypothetical protein EAZ92_08435 [Candidatus Kapaibacterium sp.]|nr:MAG: hypothetical protein EAZ92_08435 [Candidatus Kapabacteria bacterium]
MRQFFASFWFKLTGKYPASSITTGLSEQSSSLPTQSPKSRSESGITGLHRGKMIGGIELRSLGIDTKISDLDERELHPHAFQSRPKSTDDDEPKHPLNRRDADVIDNKNTDDIDKLVDDTLEHSRFYAEEDESNSSKGTKGSSQLVYSPVPEITVGSILLWGLIKTAVLVALTWFVVERYRLYEYWYAGLGVFWLLVAYPAYLQYQRFKSQTEHLEQNSLCATCRYFDATGHFCRVMDEHVSESYIPCEGLRWEGKEK